MEEIVDLVDESGFIATRGVTRRDALERKEHYASIGLYQPIVVIVLINEDDDILVQVRGKSKAKTAGLVDHTCGAVKSGETWKEAAHREAQEELGIELKSLTIVDEGINENLHYRIIVTATPVGAPMIVDKNEVSGIFYASPRELRSYRELGAHQFMPGFFYELERTTGFLPY